MIRKASMQELVLQDAARIVRHARDMAMGAHHYLMQVEIAIDETDGLRLRAAAEPVDVPGPAETDTKVESSGPAAAIVPAGGYGPVVPVITEHVVSSGKRTGNCSRCKRPASIEYLKWSLARYGVELCGICTYDRDHPKAPDQA